MMEEKYDVLLMEVLLLVAFGIAITSSSVVITSIRDNMNSTYTAPYAATVNGSAIIITFASFIKPIAWLILFAWVVTFFYMMLKSK